MNTFSKPIKKSETHEKKKLANKNSENGMLTYLEYFNKNIDLQKFTIPILKIQAKHHNLYVSGTKPVLIKRLHDHFKTQRSVIILQTFFRKVLVRFLWNIRGPALLNSQRKLCVNDTDFNTLDPINEIDFYDFYSYKDEAGFVYGFNLKSLIMMLKKTGDIINPYNRERFTCKQIRIIISLYKWRIHVQKYLVENRSLITHNNQENVVVSNTNTNNRNEVPGNLHFIRRRVGGANREENRDEPTHNIVNQQYFNRRAQVLANLDEIRNNSVERRARDLFIEIDLLGNYTNQSWFMNLTTIGYIRFIQTLYDIWTWQSNMTNAIRTRICPYFTPFAYGVPRSNIFLNRNPNIYYLKTNCLTIMENIVFSGGETEDRKLGVIHVLSALTMVSSGARHAMPWLFEALTYGDVTYSETERIPEINVVEFIPPSPNVNVQNNDEID
jgi:hypothetical protein